MIKKNTTCRICSQKTLTRFLVLGPQPASNAFLRKDDLRKKEKFYPLDAYFCHTCNLAQLVDVISKEELFRDYIYFTSGMPRISNHFKDYAVHVMKNFLKPNDFVVEIASNDGILLAFFKKHGYKTLGIEPALNIVKVAKKLGIESIPEFFSEKLANRIAKKCGKAKVIMANNVVAHIDDHQDLAKGVSAMLADDGVFVIEAPYLIDMFDNLTFDTIYHEHLSFLAVRPLKYLFERYGLEIFDVQVIPVQGVSIRVFVGKKGMHPIKSVVKKLINKELDYKLDKLSSYVKLANRVKKSKKRLLALLSKLKKQKKRIASYGAPAKGNTLLNYYKIGPRTLEFALEDLPSKQGLYTPGMHIPVVDTKFAHENEPDYYLMLAWNYKKAILEKEKKFRKKGKFIIPVGDKIEIL